MDRALWRVVVSAAIFVSLIALKLALPGRLAAVRGTLGSWLVRDADLAGAVSALGHAVSGEKDVVEALGEAYIAVTGRQPAAKEVSAPAETDGAADALDTRALPAAAVAEQRVLGFAYVPPLEGALTSPFGWRTHPRSGVEAFHYGADLAAEEGTPIVCFADGVVGAVGESTELGKYLTVTHEGGFSTLYAHCSSVTARSGSVVRRGETIAAVGQTGNATGPHLHFELHEGGKYLNPIYYLAA